MMMNMFRILICFAFSILLVGCASVDKALYEVSDGVSSVDRISGERSLNFANRQSQIAKSNAQIEQIIKQAKTEKVALNEELDAEGYKRLLKIFERVHSVSHMKDENWKLLLIPKDSFNAFVNGGTYVVVHKGLLDKIENDDEIAAILGHELSHVAANHLYEMQSHLTIATLKGSKSASRDTFHSAFTHKNEEEADEVGILYAALAGYDPYASSRLWKRMRDNEGDYSRVVVDHPINSERYERAEELARIYKRYYFKGEINPKPEEALQNNSVFGHVPEDMSVSTPAPGQGGGFLALLEVVGKGLEQHYEAKTEEIRQQTRVIRIKRAENSLLLIDKRILNPKTLISKIQYNGHDTLNNLTFFAMLGDEHVTRRIEYPINPSDTFEFELLFKTDLNETLKQDIVISVSHVD